MLGATTKDHEARLTLVVTETKMLRWMSRETKNDRIRNENVRGTTRVLQVFNERKEKRLKWYGHFVRSEEEMR